jgi:hypothetical protein
MKMKSQKSRILIVVPTRNRPKSFKNQTYRYLPFLNIDYKIFLEETQLSIYDYLSMGEVVTFEEEGLGLSWALIKAQKYAEENGYEFIFKIDDDIVNWTDLDKKVPKGNNIEGIKRVLNKFCSDSLDAFDKIPKLGGVSLPYGNELYGNLKTWYGENQRMQTCYLIRTKLYEPDILSQSTFEDFDTTLSLVKRGFKILRYGKTAMRLNDVGKGEGGLQDFDRFEQAKKAIKYFKTKYGSELKIRYKLDKSWKIEPVLNSYKWYKTKKFD